MDTREQIENYYFMDKLKVIEIAEILDISKQRVSKILTDEYKERYLSEKEKRKKENENKRKESKAAKKRESRGLRPGDVTVEELRIQQANAARSLSKHGKMSERSAVYSNLSAYKTQGRDLIYNDKVGAKPADLPRRFRPYDMDMEKVRLSINIYT